jgi:fructose-bisphosphate aldolase / 6-deoxy-5-ketofructose 1-phosphate synthase
MIIPSDVPVSKHTDFKARVLQLTKGTQRVLVFAADQIMEHATGSAPERYFNLSKANQAGALATHYGLIVRYAQEDSFGASEKIPLIIKMNGKTNLKSSIHDPESLQLIPWQAVIDLIHNASLTVAGIGYTIYLGSTHEAAMLTEAATLCFEAHQQGIPFMAWVYPRATHITQITASMLAGAAGVATSMGADIVKLSLPSQHDFSFGDFKKIREAAGNTLLVYAGGAVDTPEHLLAQMHYLLQNHLCDGFAVGRNIIDRPDNEQQKMMRALHDLVYENAPLEKLYADLRK